MRSLDRLGISIVLVAMMASCSFLLRTGENPEGNETSEKKTSTPTSLTGTKPGTGMINEDIAVILKRSGGFAGKEIRWTIYMDGQLEEGSGKMGRVDAAHIAELLAQLKSLGFFNLKQRYVPSDACCDRFLYELQVQTPEQNLQVIFLEGNPDVPSELWRSLELVKQIIDQAYE